jgi:glycosyltransferase involved in cell wall biosynthesis
VPKLSVVIPTRDRPRLLRRAVASVLEQDYIGQIECLVVFDQSPVAPVMIHCDTTNRELRLLPNSRTPGLSGTRNTGTLAAKGELIAFCDDDDEWLPEKASRQIEIFDELDHATLGCGIYVHYSGRDIARFPPVETTFRYLLRSFPMELHASTWMLHRIDSVKVMFDENMRHSEDYEWLLRVASLMRIVAVREPLVRVHWDRPSWFLGRWQNMIEGMEYLLKKHPELTSDSHGLARIYGQIAFAYAALGKQAEAKRWIFEALSSNQVEIRAYLSLLVVSGLVQPETILRWLNSFGRGV